MTEIYTSGLGIFFNISIVILILWFSEGPRQLWLWIDDRLNPFDPWIIKSRFYKKYISGTPNFDKDMRDRTIYFLYFGLVIFPLFLLLAILIWPVVLTFIICYYGLLYIRNKRRSKKQQKSNHENEKSIKIKL